MCCGYSKELSQWDGSFGHTKHKLKIMGKKIFTILRWNFHLSKPVVIQGCMHTGWPPSNIRFFVCFSQLIYSPRKFILTIWIPCPGILTLLAEWLDIWNNKSKHWEYWWGRLHWSVQIGRLLLRYLFYNLQMETGSPVFDVGSNILPQSEMGKQSFWRHWHSSNAL